MGMEDLTQQTGTLITFDLGIPGNGGPKAIEWALITFDLGIPGDGGPNAIDWAILNKEKEWGGTLLQVKKSLN